MSGLALLVALRVIANPISNVFQKQLTARSAHPVFIIAATHALLTVVCLLLVGWGGVAVRPGFWFNIWLCALLAVSGNVLLVYALRTGDLSVLGPINSYKPVVSLVAGIFVLGELPSVAGLGGILLVLAGSYFLVDRGAGGSAQAVQLRVAALVASATEAVFLKKALLLSSPGTAFVFWSILGFPLAAAISGLVLRQEMARQITVVQVEWRTYVYLAAATGMMQWSTLFTFGQLPVSYSLALFQLSTLLSVFFGHRYFQETDIRRRMLGAAVMSGGAVVIVVFGGR